MTQNEKLEEDIQNKETALEKTKEDLIKITAEFRARQQELNQKIVELGSEEFADVDIPKLLTTGLAYHESKLAGIPFKLRTLTKKETLDVDKKSKNYFDEASTYYSNMVLVDTMAYALVVYNGKQSAFDGSEEMYPIARESISALSDEVLALLWNLHGRMNRYIRAYLEINLKN